MTLLEILSQQVVGKRIVSGPTGVIGATILSVKLHPYEPMFELGVKYPDGRVDTIEILAEWDFVLDFGWLVS
jgi:hypothetical protein